MTGSGVTGSGASQVMTEADLKGCKVLVVEDDGLLSMLLQDLLAELGLAVVDTAANYEEAADKCANVECDVVMLDINLRGEQTFPIAEALLERGQPFVLVTGYGAGILPDSLRSVPLLQKPYRKGHLMAALGDALHA